MFVLFVGALIVTVGVVASTFRVLVSESRFPFGSVHLTYQFLVPSAIVTVKFVSVLFTVLVFVALLTPSTLSLHVNVCVMFVVAVNVKFTLVFAKCVLFVGEFSVTDVMFVGGNTSARVKDAIITVINSQVLVFTTLPLFNFPLLSLFKKLTTN